MRDAAPHVHAHAHAHAHAHVRARLRRTLVEKVEEDEGRAQLEQRAPAAALRAAALATPLPQLEEGWLAKRRGALERRRRCRCRRCRCRRRLPPLAAPQLPPVLPSATCGVVGAAAAAAAAALVVAAAVLLLGAAREEGPSRRLAQHRRQPSQPRVARPERIEVPLLAEAVAAAREARRVEERSDVRRAAARPAALAAQVAARGEAQRGVGAVARGEGRARVVVQVGAAGGVVEPQAALPREVRRRGAPPLAGRLQPRLDVRHGQPRAASAERPRRRGDVEEGRRVEAAVRHAGRQLPRSPEVGGGRGHPLVRHVLGAHGHRRRRRRRKRRRSRSGCGCRSRPPPPPRPPRL